MIAVLALNYKIFQIWVHEALKNDVDAQYNVTEMTLYCRMGAYVFIGNEVSAMGSDFNGVLILDGFHNRKDSGDLRKLVLGRTR